MKQVLIGEKMKLILTLKLAFMSAVLLASSLSSSFAANGDVLYSNCTAGSSCTGAGSNTGWVRTVETSGCYSGSCLKLDGVYNSNNGEYGAGSTSIGTSAVNGHDEITISYWIKFSDRATSISGGNMKGTRNYLSDSTVDHWGTVNTPNNGKDFYINKTLGKVYVPSYVQMTTSANNSSYPVDNGDGTFTSNEGWIQGAIGSGGPTPPGTNWVKLTKYLKLPSTTTSKDGVLKWWVGNDLIVNVPNAQYKSQYSSTTFRKITFYSSSEATEPFEHWMDEMIIYEGYVPPNGAVASSSSSSNSSSGADILPASPADFKQGS